MAAQTEVVKHSDLLNQLVINRTTMEEVGRIEEVWMYAPAHRVLGFICKSGFLGSKKAAFNLAQLKTFGVNGILVDSAPTETDAERVRQLESPVHCEIWSDAGNKIGKITDYAFELKTGTIRQYLFVSDGWGGIAGTIYQLPPTKILSFGNKRILVPEAAVKTFAVHRPGLHQTVARVGNFFKQDLTQELQSLAQQAQEKTEQAKQRVRSLTEQARDKAQALNDQLRETTETLTQQVKHTSQSWVEQVKEQTQGWEEAVDFQPGKTANPPSTPDGEVDPLEDWDDWDDEPAAGTTAATTPTTPINSDWDDWEEEEAQETPQTLVTPPPSPSASPASQPVEQQPADPVQPPTIPRIQKDADPLEWNGIHPASIPDDDDDDPWI